MASGPTYIPRKRRRGNDSDSDGPDISEELEKAAAKAAVLDAVTADVLGKRQVTNKNSCHEYSDADGDGYESSVEVCSVDEDAWKIRELGRLREELEAEKKALDAAASSAAAGK